METQKLKQTVAVGSKNPVKIQAVKLAFTRVFPNIIWNIIGVNVDSRVSNQPMSDLESIKGATNRAKNSLKKVSADFGVGLEGGVQKIGAEWFDCGWIVIIDKKGRKGIGSSIRMHTPDKMINMVKVGKELGEVIDILFKQTNLKQKQGHFGIMTKNAITREQGYKDGVISALVRFINPDLFE